MPLSELACRNAKKAEKPYKLADMGGLYLQVQPTGSKLWRMNFRMHGKQKTAAFGTYPAVGLADARVKRDEAKKQIAAGIDPSAQKRVEKLVAATAAATTFGAVAKEYLDRIKHENAAVRTQNKNEWLLERLAGPALGFRPIADIKPAEVLAVLEKVERSGRLETARRLRSAISKVFTLAIKTARAEHDPSISLKGATKPPIVTNRAAIVDQKKLGWLMNAIDDYDGWPTLRCALQFQALVACRPGEVRCAEWKEFDLKKSKWTIPAQRTKMRREHDVPLCQQAIDVLEDVRRLTGDQKLVFSSIRSVQRPLSENAMNSALRRIGITQEEHTAHGFRSSFSTILNELADERKYDLEVIEICLAHQDKDKVRSAYNRARKWDARVQMMADWGNLLDEFRKLK